MNYPIPTICPFCQNQLTKQEHAVIYCQDCVLSGFYQFQITLNLENKAEVLFLTYETNKIVQRMMIDFKHKTSSFYYIFACHKGELIAHINFPLNINPNSLADIEETFNKLKLYIAFS